LKTWSVRKLEAKTLPPSMQRRTKRLRGNHWLRILLEASIRGKPTAERLRIRQKKARPLLQIYAAWLKAKLETLSSKPDTTKAINYTLNQWRALTPYCEDGAIEIGDNIAENALGCVSLGRTDFLFAGSNSGGERGAAMCALIGTCALIAST
jgi:transposase